MSSSAPCHSRAFDEILARFSDRASLAPSLPESQSNLTSDSPTHIITSPNPKLRKLEARRLTTTRPVSRRFCPFPGSTCVRRTVRSTGTYNTYVLRTSVYSRQTSVRPWCTHAELAKSSSKHMESRRRQRHNERLAATHVHSHMYSTVLCALTPISCAPGTIQFADAFARPCNHSHRERSTCSRHRVGRGEHARIVAGRGPAVRSGRPARGGVYGAIARARQTVKWKSVSSGKRLARPRARSGFFFCLYVFRVLAATEP